MIGEGIADTPQGRMKARTSEIAKGGPDVANG